MHKEVVHGNDVHGAVVHTEEILNDPFCSSVELELVGCTYDDPYPDKLGHTEKKLDWYTPNTV